MYDSTRVPRIGVGVVIRRGGDVLLLRRHKVHGAGTWSTPGGYLEYGETPERCAAREVLEETGVTISSPSFLAVTNDLFPDQHQHFITLWMLADYIEGTACSHAPDEATEVRWFPHNQLPAPLFLSLANLIDGSAYSHRHWFVR